MSLGFGVNPDLPKPARTFGSSGLVPDCVLIADVVRNRAADRVHLVQRLWEKSDPSRALGENFQGFLGALGMLFVAQDSDRVDGRTVLRLQLFDSLFQRFAAGIILTVGDDK